MRLIDTLEEHDDVQAVHANFDVDAEVLERVAAASRRCRPCLKASDPAAESPPWWSSSASIPAPPTPATAWCSRAGSTLAALDGGVIETAAGQPLERRLADIHARVCDLIAEHGPTPWRSRSSTSARTRARAFAVGQARGVVLLSAGMAGCPASPTRPSRSSRRCAARGRAEKDQVQRMVGALLSLPEPPGPTTPPTRWRWPSATPTARR